MLDLTDAQLHLLRHGLGVDDRRKPPPSQPYRNYYVAGPGHTAWPDLMTLVEAGHLVRLPAASLTEGDAVFRATEQGREVALASAWKRHKSLSRSKRRYLAYLRIADVDPDLTFGEYLRRESEFKEKT